MLPLTAPRRTLVSRRRVSDIVGDEDDFYNNLIAQCKWRAAVPLVDDGAVRLQPTYVPDVAQALMNALNMHESKGQTYTLAGEPRPRPGCITACCNILCWAVSSPACMQHGPEHVAL